MTRRLGLVGVLIGSLSLILALLTLTVAKADSPANEYFDRTWQRTDKPVADHRISRTWIWGPEAFTGELTEAYADAPVGHRTVQYFDKSRMEITSDPNVPTDSLWYVTNGLLVKEMVTGKIQLGDTKYKDFSPATVNVAGDSDDPNGPTYASFHNLLYAPPVVDGVVITQRVGRSGDVSNDASLANMGVTAAFRVQTDGIHHQVASPFWEFMNSEGPVLSNGEYYEDQLFPNPFYATGYPITEAYWATVKLAGVNTNVLMQCFERRCLTYTPDNPSGWQVEAGNVGRHYYTWRYEQLQNIDQPPSEASPTVTSPGAGGVPTSTAIPTVAQPNSTPPPTMAPPSPTATPIDPPLSQAYLYPEAATRAALEETCNCDASAANPIIQSIVSKAYTYRHQYHLATADVGSFNRDTSNFYAWLTDYLAALTTPGTVPQSFNPQVHAAIYQPTSPIGIELRRLEAGLDPLFAQFGAGPEVYWTYLIDPAIRMSVNPLGYEAYRGVFNDLVNDYHDAFFATPSYTGSFGDYLASVGFSLD